MNLSAEKRKMPRMQMDLSASIFWGLADNQSDVSVQNLSIHGISFRSKKYFTEGAQIHLTLPTQSEFFKRKKIQAQVVRCETLNGFSSNGKFRVGAKFLFQWHGLRKYEENSIAGTLSSPQPLPAQNSLLKRYKDGLKNYPLSANTKRMSGSSTLRIGMREVNAELIHSVRTPAKEETIFTRIQIKQARYSVSPAFPSPLPVSSEKLLAGTDNKSPVANLARRKFSR